MKMIHYSLSAGVASRVLTMIPTLDAVHDVSRLTTEVALQATPACRIYNFKKYCIGGNIIAFRI